MAERLHKNTVAGVIEALEITFGKHLYADKVVDRILRQNKKWGKRDRAFVAKNTYEIVRHWRKLWALLDKEPSLKRKDLEKLFGIWWLYQGNELPDWPKYDSIRDFNINQAVKALPNSITILESYPDWLHNLATEELGKEWPEIARNLNKVAPVAIRVNILKTTVRSLKERLSEEGINTSYLEGYTDALLLEGRPKLNHLESFKQGLFEVHDAGSQTIAPFLQATPNSVVIDACAGAGGKALHLASQMNNKGKIIALDVVPYKLSELDKRAQRNGVSIIETRHIESSKAINALKETADFLLMDVPCSGTGVIRRDVDTKWKLKPEHLERTMNEQKHIIDTYSTMLKPGGTMVYATCSILKSENEHQVQWFLDQNLGKYELIEDKRVNPSDYTDGFYMARIKKMTS